MLMNCKSTGFPARAQGHIMSIDGGMIPDSEVWLQGCPLIRVLRDWQWNVFFPFTAEVLLKLEP